MRRMFCENITTPCTVLDKATEHYAKNVLRLKNGEKILLFDGKQEVSGVLSQNMVEIVEIVRNVDNEKPLKLAIAGIKQARFEWLVEKATEIGCTEIFVLQTQFTQNVIRNFPRIEKIAIEAARQSNRISVPKIHDTVSFDEFLNNIELNTWIYGSLDDEDLSSHNLNGQHDQFIGVLIGPEGGFEKKEIMKLQKKVVARKFARNILRAETAALVGLIYIS